MDGADEMVRACGHSKKKVSRICNEHLMEQGL